MTLNLELSLEEARLLERQLAGRAAALARELAGTSKRELQHELAGEEKGLEAIVERLRGLIAARGT